MRKTLSWQVIGVMTVAILFSSVSVSAYADNGCNYAGDAGQVGLYSSDRGGASDNFTATLIEKLASILGIDVSTLTTAYETAMQKVAENMTASENLTRHGLPPSDNMTPPEKPASDNMSPPGGPPSDNMTPPSGPPSDNVTGGPDMGVDKLLIETLASILNIDESKLSDAFQQVMRSMEASKPASDNGTGPGGPPSGFKPPSDNMTGQGGPPSGFKPPSDNMTGQGGPPSGPNGQGGPPGGSGSRGNR